MTTATVNDLFADTARVLGALKRGYESIWAELQGTDEALADLALYLSAREQRTITALDGFRERHEDLAALEVHIRLGAGFPFDEDDLQIPRHPTLDELIELGERTDMLLEHLSQRIQVYAVSGSLMEVLDAIEELVGARRRGLAAALHELEKHQPSPEQIRE